MIDRHHGPCAETELVDRETSSGTVGAVEAQIAIEIGVLGRVQVHLGSAELPVAGTRLRQLLVRFAVDAGSVVPATELVDAVWPEAHLRPDGASNALQSLISRLRRVLAGSAAVQQLPGGYRLSVGREQVDLHRFTRLARNRTPVAPGR